MKPLLIVACAAVSCLAADPGRMVTHYAGSKDLALTADPSAPHWKKVKPVVADHARTGEPVPNHRTEIRSVWTDANLYLLFTCPYETLHVNESPSTRTETNKLWDRDVAEAFIAWDPNNITRYKEFQVSPLGEWVDLDIDRKKPLPEGGWLWNSGYEVKARIDEAKKVWYGEMRIPWKSIDERPVRAGNELRINLYRIQGPPPNRVMISWRPIGPTGSYHQPDKFGTLVLAK